MPDGFLEMFVISQYGAFPAGKVSVPSDSLRPVTNVLFRQYSLQAFLFPIAF
jgi:hypothetical protein